MGNLGVVLLQLILLCITVYIGWELAILLIKPEGSNWMWVMEMHYFVVIVSVVVLIGGYIRSVVNPKYYIYIVLGQIVLFLIFLVPGLNLRPFRTTFLGICGLITIVFPLIFRTAVKQLGI